LERGSVLGYSIGMDIEAKGTGPLFEAAEAVGRAAVESVDPGRLIIKNVFRVAAGASGKDAVTVQGKTFDLGEHDRVFLAGFGKAAEAMAGAMADILGDRLAKGVVVSPDAESGTRGRLEFIKGSHPLPDEGSVEGARRVLALANEAGERDILFLCVSGGGSALLCLPAPGLSLEDKRRVTSALLKAGADITELNAVRKHLSAVKGGRLVRAASPAAVVSLVVSDVLENDLASIASGPAHWDGTTYGDARRVLEKYGLWDEAPPAVRDLIEKGARGEVEETVKEGDPVLERVHTFIVGDNMTALRAAKAEAERRGFETIIMTSSDSGEARKAAANYAAFLAEMACSAVSLPRPLCLLAGGELTVTVKGKGKGGRNTEFVLASLVEMGIGGLEEAFCAACDGRDAESGGEGERRPALDWLIMSLGTDGIDGPTDAAGAWAGPRTLERARSLGLEAAAYLDDNDSYAFFEKTENLIVTGPTGTNVMDVRVFMLRTV
jgi:glycerate 2-kinase